MDDPALGDGWAHWVSLKPYHEYVKKYGHQVEVRIDLSALYAASNSYSTLAQHLRL